MHPSLTDLILYAVQHLTLPMGGHQGVRLFRALYEAGMGQGDPFSDLLYCLLNEVRVQFVLQSAGLTATPGGPLGNLGNAMYAVRTQCEVLDVGKYSNPSFGPFSQASVEAVGFALQSTLPER